MRSRTVIMLAAVLTVATSCFKDSNFDFKAEGEGSASYLMPGRVESPDIRNVMLMVAGGFNSLSSYLAEDQEMLASGWLPNRTSAKDNILVVLSRLPEEIGTKDYSVPSAPVLYRLYAGTNGLPTRDTLKVWDAETPVSLGSTIEEALHIVYNRYPAKGYGMVFSSHASGWLPVEYYFDPAKFESSKSFAPGSGRSLSSLKYPWRMQNEYFPPLDQAEGPAVKSVGRDDGNPVYEMNMDDFARAIPFKLDYLLFDACLMGCVEVAWELREKADLVGFSQTEVLADGFDYSTISMDLLLNTPDPKSVCEDYFKHYDALTGDYRSATISLVDTREMDGLAALCKTLFEKYRTQIAALKGKDVQGYFRQNRHFYYDLEDILVKAGISEEEHAQLSAALDKCVIYKAATPSFLSITISRYSGFSMYLPSMGSTYLDNFYRSKVAWNKATSLIN